MINKNNICCFIVLFGYCELFFYCVTFSQFCEKCHENSQFLGLGHVPKMPRKNLENVIKAIQIKRW